jgi:hypothetical protein
MRKITVLIPMVLILIFILPLLYYEINSAVPVHFSFKAVSAGNYTNITEGQLLYIDFRISDKFQHWMHLSKADTVFINHMGIPVITTITFERFNEAKPLVYLPQYVTITYRTKYDSVFFKNLNTICNDEENPHICFLNDLPDTTYLCEWEYDLNGKRYLFAYQQAAGSQQSRISSNIFVTKFHLVLNYYARLLYEFLPSFLVPQWYKTISSDSK